MNKVLIIGGEHHNGLGLARICGLNNFEVHSFVVSSKKTNFLKKSKFVKYSRLFTTEKEALDYIVEHYSGEEDKPFIIPYSDGAAFEVDSRLDNLKKDFFVPSISEKQGEIVRLMNKENQYIFAKQNNIKMARTDILDLTKNLDIDNLDFPFPCILKPIISAAGDKKDISICYNKNDLFTAINVLIQKDYKNILIQEYLSVDYEIDVFGCICKHPDFISLIPTKTIRAYPPKGGTNSFSQIITDTNIIEKCKRIIQVIGNNGFYGLYDIELFVVGDEILLNEINFRNSGDVYMALKQEYYYPMFWIEDVLLNYYPKTYKPKIQRKEFPKRPDYCMTEFADLRNVLKHTCSFNEWIKDYKRTTDFALKFKGDMRPYYSRFIYYLFQFLGRKKDY